MECRHDRAGRDPAGKQRKARRDRLMDVQDIELAVTYPTANPARGHEPECEPRDRSVVWDGHVASCCHDIRVQRRVVIGRRDQRHVVAEREQRLRQVPDVRLHPAWHIPGVGADEAYFHWLAPSGLALLPLRPVPLRATPPSAGARRSGSRSATKTFCSMCQSAGCSRMPASNTRATCWVIAATLSFRWPASGTSISS